MVTKRESIAKFLAAKARPELSALYNENMEVQVNVAKDNGELIQGEFNGHQWRGWTDGSQTWKHIRIPFGANSEPHYEESQMSFDLAAHAEGVGMTGFDFVNQRSIYVAYDFDAISGHSEKHEKKLSEADLTEVRERAKQIPWVTVRQSTSGNGLHLYVFLDFDEKIKNHSEHSAVARAILGKMGALAGFDFDAKVDNCGSNIWIWHRKFEKVGGVAGPGLKLIKMGERLREVPINWRDHIRVTGSQGAKRKLKPGFIEESEVDWFEEFCGQNQKVPLDAEHRELLKYLDSVGAMWWFDNDHHMLVCHTYDLAQAHKALSMRGVYKTSAAGREHGVDQNCFAYPQRKGAWVVRRHTKGVGEADTWEQDKGGWTRCWLNRDPDLRIAARSLGGNEDDKGRFNFQSAEQAIQAIAALGVNMEIPNFLNGRRAWVRPNKDGRLILEIHRESGDSNKDLQDWIEEKGKWKRLVNPTVAAVAEQELGNYDDVVRHLVTEADEDAGWVIKTGRWTREPILNVKMAVRSLGVPDKELQATLGTLVMRKWTLVSRPFEPEYPGGRIWNKDSAQLAFTPEPEVDLIKCQTWLSMINHCGSGLDDAVKLSPWCKENGIKTGGDYLVLWIAALFNHPKEHLPYLFMFGPQSSGKTTFADAIAMLMTKGVERADAALINQAGFNGELEGKVLCIVEETDLRNNKNQAYNRIKDWVTNDKISIHGKNKQPYSIPNTTHWIHNSNNAEECPIFPGDTRITVCYVKELEALISKSELMAKLRKEAPDFLAYIRSIDIPKSNDRNFVPVIESAEKVRAQKLNQTELEAFLEEATYPVQGEWIKVSELHERLVEWVDANRVAVWSKIKMNRELQVLGYAKGRDPKDGSHYIGNISWRPRDPGEAVKPKLIVVGDFLMPEGSK